MTNKNNDKNSDIKTRVLKEDEKTLWQKIVQTLDHYTPVFSPDKEESFADLLDEGKKRQKSPDPKVEIKPQLISKELSTKQKKVKGKPLIDSGMDLRTSMRLKRGQFPIDGVLDLHGLGREDAYQRLIGFIQNAYHNKSRNVLVITGKGRMSKGGVGILKRELPKWLKDSPLNEIVLSYETARKKDGGDGAFYILLRRQK